MSLRPTSYEAAKIAAARYSQKRKQRLEAKPSWKPLKRGGRLKAGKKTHEWDNERRKLKVRFANAGIMVCELRYAGCAFDNLLGFAHAKKRRNLSSGELSEVALLCNFCHDVAERLPEAEMTILIRKIIAARLKQP